MKSLNRLLLLLLAFVFFLTHLATAAKYTEWADLPDCAQLCIKYQAINAGGLRCPAQNPKCYCNQPAWRAPMEDCIYGGELADCKTTVEIRDKDNILAYIDEVFCPTLNGTKQAAPASSSQVRVEATSSDSEDSSAIATTSDTQSSSTSTLETSSSSSSTSSASASASEDDDMSTTTATSTTTSSSTSSSSSSSSESSSAPTTTTTTTTSLSSSAADTSSLPSASSSSSMSTTTTVVVVTASVPHTTRPSASTTITNFVQDTVTVTDGAVPGAHALFYDGHMETMLGVSSTMALVLVIAGMLVLVG